MTNILFIGNSFTYYHEMPAMVRAMAEQLGLAVQVDQLTYGGYTLARYTNPEDEHGREAEPMIRVHPWNYVVLQEQSATPALRPELFARGVQQLMPHIRRCGAKPVFYETWAYRKGSGKLEASGMEYEEMLERLTAAYEKEARKYEGLTVPVGEAFARVHRENPRLSLYCPDDYHPNLAGSYLAAALFLKRLLGAKAPESWLPEGLDEDTAALLRSYVE